MTPEDEKIVAAIPGLTPDVLKISRAQFGKTAVMPQVLNELAKREIEKERNALETCEAEDLKKIQGIIAGLKRMQGIINNQTP